MGAWTWDIPTGKITWTENLEPMHGLAPGSYDGTFETFISLVHPDDRQMLIEAVQRAIRERELYDTEFRIVWPDGTVRWMGGKGLAFYDEAGTPTRMIGMGIDVTERKRLEEELVRRADELAEADERKDQFLAVLGHEMRNPLSVINNALFLLRRPDLDAGALDRVRAVLERQVSHVAAMMDDLLDISRITRGKILLNKEPLDLADLVRSAMEDHRAMIEKARLNAVLELPSQPIMIHGDRTRLTQILGNLVQNASKFTDEGGTITVEVVPRPDEGRVSLIVRDTGVGIEPDVMPSLFESFSQAEASRNRSREGLGLGLSLVKGLVELHDGRITAHSDGPGHGAEFTVDLPMVGP
jgi:PAS domain S-box-containing protein